MKPTPESSTSAPPPQARGQVGFAHNLRLTLFPWVAATALVLTASCKKKAAPTPPPPPAVEVLTITPTNLPLSHEIIGQLDSPENVEVRARVEAFVDKVLFVEGTDVKPRDPLFLLDKAPFEERLAAARGQLAQARAALNKYLRDVDRLRPLADKKAIPQQDLDNAEASVEVGKAAVLSAEAIEKSALLDLGYCEVTAPIAGRIGARQVAVGDLVGKGEPTLLATISKLDPIWFYCGIPEVGYLRTESAAQKSGKSVQELPVTLILANGEPHPAPGKFVFIDRAVDPKTGTLRVRAEFPNPGGILRPGMFARIRIDLGTQPNSVVVPERAISELQGRSFVWVVEPDDTTRQRSVTTQDLGGGHVLVRDGLKPGERIVTEGLQKVREGGPVHPMTAEELMAQAAAAQSAGRSPAPHGKE